MPARLLKQTNLMARLRGAWRHDADEALKPVRKELRRLAHEVEALQTALQEASVRAARGDRNASQLRMIAELNEQQRHRLGSLPALLDKEQLAASIGRAVAAAPMRADPFDHVVVEDVLPSRVYDLLLEALPPTVFFSDHNPIKQDLAPGYHLEPHRDPKAVAVDLSLLPRASRRRRRARHAALSRGGRR